MAIIYCAKNNNGKFVNVSKKEFETKKALGKSTKIADKGKNCDGTPLVVVAKKYKCVSGACKEDPTGTYTEPTCQGKCSVVVAKKYKCVNGTCIEDPTGTYTEPTCGGNCSTPPPGPTPPPSPKSCSSPSTPFSSVSDSAKFRDFVYKYYPSVAGQHDLWLSTDPRLLRLSKQWNTCSIRKSYSEVDQKDPSKRSIGNLFLLWSQDPSALTWISGSNPQQNMDDPKIQMGVWEKLIENKQIYTRGLIVNVGNKKVYVIKTDLNNDTVKYPLTIAELRSPDMTKFDYLVLYPINMTKKYPIGNIGILYMSTNQDGEPVVRIKQEPNWTWEPAAIEDELNFELQEQIITKGNRNSNQGTNTPGTINRGSNSSNSLNLSNKATPREIFDVIEPIRSEAYNILIDLKPTADKVGAGKEMDEAITLLQTFDSSKSCETGNLQQIKDAKDKIQKLKKDNPVALAIAGGVDKKLDRLTVLLDNVITECDRLSKIPKNKVDDKVEDKNKTELNNNIGTPKTKDELRVFFGFVTNDGITYNPKSKILNMEKEEGIVGEFDQGTVQNAINKFGARSEYFHKYNELMSMEGLSSSRLVLPEGVVGAGEVITENNYSVLVPLKSNESSRQFKKLTFGTYLDTTCPSATIEVMYGKGSVQKSVGCSCDESAESIIEKLKTYLIAALTGDESSRPNREGAAKEFCGCFKTGKFDELIGINGLKIDASSLTGVSKTRLPKTFFDRKLGWKEITNLLRGERVNRTQIAGPFRIPDFGDDNCRCIGSGSLEESIKRHVTKTINNKKTVLKEERIIKSILSKIRKVGK